MFKNNLYILQSIRLKMKADKQIATNKAIGRATFQPSYN